MPAWFTAAGSEGKEMPSERSGASHALDVVLYFSGVVGAFVWLHSSVAEFGPFLVAVLATGLRNFLRDRRPRKSSGPRRSARLALTLLHCFCGYQALVFGWLLGWSVPPPLLAIVALVGVLCLMGVFSPVVRLRVPVMFPVGLWILLCLAGWLREDGAVRCEDYLRARDEPGVSIPGPSTSALASCRSGEVFRMSRYARRLWEAPDSSRYLVATQPGLDTLTYGIPVPDPVEGDVCEVTSGSYSCVGNNHHKMQAIFESEALDRVFVAGFAGTETLGILYAIPRTGPLRIVDELRMDLNYGEGYFDPTTGEIGLFEDGVRKFMRIRAADLSPVSVSEVSFCPGETHYDPERNEGIICFDAGPLMPLVRGAYSPYLSLAFRSNPFSYRPLGGGLAGAWAYGALAWGCDFDPVQRRAWILIANLGLVAEVDYDTGKLTRLRRVEPGLRTAVFDPQRRLLYMGNFLKGDVIAWDVDKGQEVHRWFAGRFLRYVGLSRDRNQLLVASNLGVVRIDISAGSPSRGS